MDDTIKTLAGLDTKQSDGRFDAAWNVAQIARLTLPAVREFLTAISRLCAYSDTRPIFVPALLRLSYVLRSKVSRPRRGYPGQKHQILFILLPKSVAQCFYMSVALAHVFVCLFVDCPTKDDLDM
jgi:hypothetical protein